MLSNLISKIFEFDSGKLETLPPPVDPPADNQANLQD